MQVLYGLNNVFNDSAFTQRQARWSANGDATTLTNQGTVALSVTGSLTTSNLAATNAYTISRRVEVLVTAAATNAAAGIYAVKGLHCGQTGFTMFAEWGLATGVSNATSRAFCGFGTGGGIFDMSPSGQTNVYGVGWDSDDTNVQFMHNDGSGTCTKIDLGTDFPRPDTDRTQVYQVRIWTFPASGIIEYHITNLSNGAVAFGNINSNLPAATAFLLPRIWTTAGGTSSVTGIAFYDMWIGSDR